jgi:sec-independent protein translocase protein TatB
MFDIGPEKIILILLVALIVLGPDQLPDTARKIGNVLSQLRRMSEGVQAEVRRGFTEAAAPPLPPDAHTNEDPPQDTAA